MRFNLAEGMAQPESNAPNAVRPNSGAPQTEQISIVQSAYLVARPVFRHQYAAAIDCKSCQEADNGHLEEDQLGES
jgi:hypothetical protein